MAMRPLRNAQTECSAKQFLIRLEARAPPFVLLRNSRKTECGARQFLNRLEVRRTFALSKNLSVTHADTTEPIAA